MVAVVVHLEEEEEVVEEVVEVALLTLAQWKMMKEVKAHFPLLMEE
jgi:hypothetical protein